MSTRQSNAAINLPNALTLIRLLLTPLFVILLLRDQITPALVVFCLAGISDGLDGFIARYFDQRTLIGAYLDPVADKALLMSAFVCLAIMGMIPDWLTVMVLSRDILIVIGIAILTVTGKTYHIHPSLVSKCTTVAQIAMVIVSLMATGIPLLQAVKAVLVPVTAALTAISGLHYVYIGMNMLQSDSGSP
jgi:cardiolipin synthase (CMP-forming)